MVAKVEVCARCDIISDLIRWREELKTLTSKFEETVNQMRQGHVALTTFTCNMCICWSPW